MSSPCNAQEAPLDGVGDTLEEEELTAPAAVAGAASYRETVKATGVTGGASVVQVLVRLVRSKVIAVVVGPEGIGFLGLLGSAIQLATTFAAMGMGTSGVRQVAAATDDRSRDGLALSVSVLTRSALGFGTLGALAVFLLARPIAQMTTGSVEHAVYLRLLAPVVFLAVVARGQMAVLRGLRQITALAKLTVASSVAGALVGIPFVVLLGLRGIPYAILASAAGLLLASWWHYRNVTPSRTVFSLSDVRKEFTALTGLGLAFLVVGLQTSGVQYVLRTMLLHLTDMQTVGQFLAGAALSHVYATFILRAMGLDYLPRLTTVQHDRVASNRLVNEQTEIALLLGIPGIVALLTLAPMVIPLLYSSRFGPAIEVFRWQCLGVALKLMCWPIGFLFVARGMKWLFAGKETVVSVLYVGVFWSLAGAAGLLGAAMAYPVLYLVNLAILHLLARRVSGFRWSAEVRRVVLVALAAIALALAAQSWLGPAWGAVAGLAISAGVAVWTYRELCSRLELPLAALVILRVRSLVDRLPGVARGRR